MLNVDQLISIYTNEKSTKLLLQYSTLVDEFNYELRQHALIDKCTEESLIIKAIQEIEIERVKYLVKEYIQCRFDKLKSNLYLNTSLMSTREQIFYSKYLELIKKKDVYQEGKNTDTYFVGFTANKNIEAVKIDDTIVKIYKGDFFVAKSEDIIEYLKEDIVTLA